MPYPAPLPRTITACGAPFHPLACGDEKKVLAPPRRVRDGGVYASDSARRGKTSDYKGYNEASFYSTTPCTHLQIANKTN
eukprot:1036828-Rhodomonas_salina.1